MRFLLLLVAMGAAWAQVNTGTINLEVKDSTGALIPGVTQIGRAHV